MLPLISVVVPVYNTEKYLDNCIMSIANQTYKNIEIILVDDESTDNSGKICDDWAERDDRIKVIHQKNAGAGMARNSGLAYVTGDYVSFVDSDDFVDSMLYSDVVNMIERHGGFDLLKFAHRRVNEDGVIISELKPRMSKEEYIEEAITNEFLVELIDVDPFTGLDSGMIASICTSIYNVNLVRKCNFSFVSERTILSEDTYSMLSLAPELKKVLIINKTYYNYRLNNVSFTRGYRSDRFIRSMEFSRQIQLLCEKNKYRQELRVRLMGTVLSYVISCIKIEVENSKSNGFCKMYKNVKMFLEDDELAMLLKQYPAIKYNKAKKVLFYFMKKKSVGIVILLAMYRNLLGN